MRVLAVGLFFLALISAPAAVADESRLCPTCPGPFGRCCFPDGGCLELDVETCERRCGAFAGKGTDCSGEPACETKPTGACCMGDEVCLEAHGACTCEKIHGGSYEGAGSTCETSYCVGVCDIDPFQTMLILHPDVVDDPVRTGCSGPDPADCGPWSFAAVAASVAGTTERRSLSEFVIDLFDHFGESQTINTFEVEARPVVADSVLPPWIEASGGELLDFSVAPFRLLAIVNRPDLRNDNPVSGKVMAGEGRFVFGVLPAGGFTNFFTVIFEFKLVGNACDDVRGWQYRWGALSRFEDFGPEYRRALQEITDDFATIGADPTAPNGSALAHFRSNEFLQPVLDWELREFRLLCPGDPVCTVAGDGVCTDSGVHLVETTVHQTPDASINSSLLLTNYLNEFADEILDGSYRVPCSYQGGQFNAVPFRAAIAPVDIFFGAPNVDPNVRSTFAFNTCSGCHQIETGTNFQHIQERLPGQQSSLSPFLESDIDPRLSDLCNNVLLETCEVESNVDDARMPPVPPTLAGRAH